MMRAYRAILFALIARYPAPFRAEFAGEMEEQVERDLAAARSRGALQLWWCFAATAFDLARGALTEHWDPAWVNPRITPRRKKDMRELLEQWGGDLRHATRALMRSPGFTMVTAGTLALAIGANAGLFSVVKTVLLDPLPYANADRLVHIAATAPGSDFPDEFGVAAEFLVQYRERAHTIEDVSTVNSFTSTLRTKERVERVRMSEPTNSLFSTLGARPILGRLPVDADENHVAVISYALWQNWFGGDSTILGQTLDVSGSSRTVVGVMGPDFEFPRDGVMLWMSSVVRPEGITPGRFGSPLVARLAPGVTPEQAARELTALSKQLPERFGGTPNYARLIEQHRAVVRPLKEQMLGPAANAIWILFGAVAIVFLIACANVANLFLVRSEGRQRDLAVRRAIGAARSQLIRLQLSEAFVVALIAGALAVALTFIALPMLVHASPPGVPRLDSVHVTGGTIAFTAGAVLLAALVCGLYPAVRASAPDLTRLREGGRGATRSRRWVRDGLVVAQTAMALVLLIGSGLLVRSFQKLRDVDPGYSTKDLFSFQIAPERPSLNDGPSFARFDMDFMERLRALPGVEQVGLVENLPLNEGTSLVPFRADGGTSDVNEGKRMRLTFAAGDYFSAMDIAVRAGHAFPPRDLAATQGTVVISQKAADLMWPGLDPIGRRLQQGNDSTWYTVVGVVEDVLQNDLRETAEPLVYFPLVGPTPRSWAISSPAFVLKTARAETIASEVRALVHEVAPEAPMYRVYTMAGLAADSMVALRFTMFTLGVVSALALLLGTIGLYGVLSYVVAERTREIGVRMALGARAEQVRRMVVGEGARVVGVGAAIGVVVALGTTRLMESMLFGVAPLDWITFVAMSAAMLAVGMLASYVPARRASRVAPMESLRGE